MLFEFHLNPDDFVCEGEEVGEGNFGKVSLVHRKDNPEEKIAMKKIPYDPDDFDTQKYFVREVTSMIDLNHPCILKLIGYSLCSSKDNCFIIYTPYIPNKSLISILKADEHSDEKLLDPTKLSIIVYGIASGMDHMHKKNFIHRDLKPENILLDEEFHPIIADFGFSRVYDELNMTGKLGTPFYMAPELFGDADKTNKIDVYAFGVTLLQLFTPSLKFKKRPPRDYPQFVRLIKNGDRYLIPETVPEFYVNLIEKCWDQNPKNRPSFEEIVQLFENNDDFMFPGSNAAEVKKFINKLKTDLGPESGTTCTETCSQETQSFPF